MSRCNNEGRSFVVNWKCHKLIHIWIKPDLRHKRICSVSFQTKTSGLNMTGFDTISYQSIVSLMGHNSLLIRFCACPPYIPSQYRWESGSKFIETQSSHYSSCCGACIRPPKCLQRNGVIPTSIGIIHYKKKVLWEQRALVRTTCFEDKISHEYKTM